MLEGEFDVIHGDVDDWHRAGPDDYVHVRAGTVHTTRAVTETARLISVYAPAGGEEFFREVGAVDQHDLGAVTALAERHGMRFPGPAPSR